jgi:hypothetical protein
MKMRINDLAEIMVSNIWYCSFSRHRRFPLRVQRISVGKIR